MNDDTLIDVLAFLTRQILARLELTARRFSSIINVYFIKSPYYQVNTLQCAISLEAFELYLPKRHENDEEAQQTVILYSLKIILQILKFGLNWLVNGELVKLCNC